MKCNQIWEQILTLALYLFILKAFINIQIFREKWVLVCPTALSNLNTVNAVLVSDLFILKKSIAIAQAIMCSLNPISLLSLCSHSFSPSSQTSIIELLFQLHFKF